MTDYPVDSTKNHPNYDPEYNEPEDDGTMPRNVATLANQVVGRRIVKSEVQEVDPKDFKAADPQDTYWSEYGRPKGLVLTLDDGRRVILANSSECCAHTYLEKFLLHPERVDHAITGVASTNGYTKWHIFADLGDILELDVEWSAGNPFYYGYGFDIAVSNTIEGTLIQHELEAGTND